MLTWIRAVDRGTSRAVATVALAMVALVLLAAAVRHGPSWLDAFDEGLWSVRASAIGSLLGTADLVAGMPVWVALVVTVAIALSSVSLAHSVRLVALIVVAELASTLVKLVVDRPRPLGAESFDLLVSSGFPSGHVTRVAVAVGGLLVLVPFCRRHPIPVIGLGLVAILIVGLARVSARAHYTTDVLGACLLTAALLGSWYLLDPSSRVTKPAARKGSVRRAGFIASLPLAILLVGPSAVWATSPSRTPVAGEIRGAAGRAQTSSATLGQRSSRRSRSASDPSSSPPSTSA